MKTAKDRFLSKVNKTESCWEWTACILQNGYGQFFDKKKVYAHRFSYELHREPIPAEMTIDHLCKNRKCVNPDHLEVVTNTENIRRALSDRDGYGGFPVKTLCVRGHDMSEAVVTWVGKQKKRACRPCNAANQRAFKERKKQKYDVTRTEYHESAEREFEALRKEFSVPPLPWALTFLRKKLVQAEERGRTFGKTLEEAVPND